MSVRLRTLIACSLSPHFWTVTMQSVPASTGDLMFHFSSCLSFEILSVFRNDLRLLGFLVVVPRRLSYCLQIGEVVDKFKDWLAFLIVHYLRFSYLALSRPSLRNMHDFIFFWGTWRCNLNTFIFKHEVAEPHHASRSLPDHCPEGRFGRISILTKEFWMVLNTTVSKWAGAISWLRT